MTTTLASSLNDILSFGFLTGFVVITFTLPMALNFREVSGYETIYTAIISNLESMLNKFRYDTVAEGTGVVGGAFLLIYVLTMMIIVINMFVSMLNGFLTALKSDREKWANDAEVIAHLAEMLKSMITGVDPDDKPKTSTFLRVYYIGRWCLQ
jgi:hypothetical protein